MNIFCDAYILVWVIKFLKPGDWGSRSEQRRKNID